MNLRKQAYRFYIGFSLLLSFTATQLPFELLHSHNSTTTCNGQNSKDGICTHKTHIGKQERFCWACVIQVEKTFDVAYEDLANPYISFNNNVVSDNLNIHSQRCHFNSLRGPPSFNV